MCVGGGGGGEGEREREREQNNKNKPDLKYLCYSPVHVALGKEPRHSIPERFTSEVFQVRVMSHGPFLRVLAVFDGYNWFVGLQLVAQLG